MEINNSREINRYAEPWGANSTGKITKNKLPAAVQKKQPADAKGPKTILIGQEEVSISPKEELVVGAEAFQNNELVAASHCILSRNAQGAFFVRDLASDNGTFIRLPNLERVHRIPRNVDVPVAPGAIIFLGGNEGGRIEIIDAGTETFVP
jgi:pSer/pThr/pTyr-binding forkhead associated (FHA) protein